MAQQQYYQKKGSSSSSSSSSNTGAFCLECTYIRIRLGFLDKRARKCKLKGQHNVWAGIRIFFYKNIKS